MNIIGRMLNNRYEVLAQIGNGGMAIVYRAKDQVLNRFVAIKVLKDEFTTDSEFIKRFKAEAQAAARLTHPNIVQIFDVCNEDNLYYIVMELIQGKTLKEIIVQDGILSWKWSVNIAIQIASALEIAHKNNIIHRDIKPHNIIITEDGIAKVTDFGIAKAVSNSTITAFGTTIGSVHYFSPEHARGGYTDAKSDIYSLGIVMYEMLTGRVPFDADTPVSVALKQVQEEPVEPIYYNSNIPISVNRIILKAMQKDPNMRYQSATEMLQDLSYSLKKPSEDFVEMKERSADSPTQKIPTIYDMEVEKNNASRLNKEKEIKQGKLKKFYAKHKWAGPVTLILVAIILFIVALNVSIHIFNGSRVDQAIMPDVCASISTDTRMTKDEATKALNDVGFTDISYEEEYSDDVESGYVIKQSPNYKANFKINVTEPITLTISKGQKMVTLPKKIVGKDIEEVKTNLDQLEIKYEITEQTDEKIEAGKVISIDPEAEGQEISAATVIKLVVSSGSQYKDVTMISVVGQTESSAKSALEALGLVVSVSYEENASKSDGVVTSQSVQSGSTIKEGQTVNLVVNKQPTESVVTISIDLKSLMNYTTPTPTVVQNITTDENGNTVVTNTTVTPEVKNSKVVIQVGSDTIASDTYPLTTTSITQNWKTSGVKEVKVIVDGVTKFTQSVDFSKGNQTITVK